MRIVTERQVGRWAVRYPNAAGPLRGWLDVAKGARWTTLAETRRTYAHADAVTVASGKTVTVFNVGGNKYRLITAIPYNTGIVFTLLFLTHAEYSRNQWKDRL